MVALELVGPDQDVHRSLVRVDAVSCGRAGNVVGAEEVPANFHLGRAGVVRVEPEYVVVNDVVEDVVPREQWARLNAGTTGSPSDRESVQRDVVGEEQESR